MHSASLLAQTCATEYGKDVLGTSRFFVHGYGILGTVNKSDDRCSVLHPVTGPALEAFGEGLIVVVFRGTESDGYQLIADWGANARVIRWYDKRVGWAQKGHLRGAQALFPGLIDILPRRPVILTGHSRGGGLAIIMGCMLRAWGLPAEDLRIVTFGAPRVTMEGSRERLAGVSVSQYAHRRDPVVKVMPRWWLARYRHVRRYWMNDGRDLRALEQHKIGEYATTLSGLKRVYRSESVFAETVA